MQHQDRKCHQGRLLHQCVSLSAKKNEKEQNRRGDEIKLKAINPESQDRNCSIEVKMI